MYPIQSTATKILNIIIKMQENEEREISYSRFMVIVGGSFLAGGMRALSIKDPEAWLFRDDIGAPHGIKGYEEQVNSVGLHHGHCHWPSEITWNTYNSAT